MINELMRLTVLRRRTASGEAKHIRQCALMSQQEMANAIRVDPSTIGRWERGERAPHGEAAIRYGKLLDKLSTLVAQEVPNGRPVA